MAGYRLGVDIGGTFTDIVLLGGDGVLFNKKILSTPDDYSRAIEDGVRELLETNEIAASDIGEVAHGTTVATNAIIERKGVKVALITTEGFRDVLEIARFRAPRLYDIGFRKPEPLVERRLRFTVPERITATGEVDKPLDEKELMKIANRCAEAGVNAIAVCFLNAYVNPRHEEQSAILLNDLLPGIPVTRSSELVPQIQEYERTSTAVVNAYIRPVIERYAARLEERLAGIGITAPVNIMQSNGGVLPAKVAAQKPIFVIESGPAAGVVGAQRLGEKLDIPDCIVFDMGGTTAKASIIAGGDFALAPETEVGGDAALGHRMTQGGGYVVQAPTIDIAEVGAGGGSIAWIDSGGGIQVGPHSAGAAPGPVCYGQGGTEATVTDANLLLGYLNPSALVGGELNLDWDGAQKSLQALGDALGQNLTDTAYGIHLIANARMMRALRAVSTERGRDARDFALMAFGGSGPIHAAGLARELRIGRLVVPPLPGLFSARGLLFSGIEHHKVRSCLLTGFELPPGALTALRAPLQRELLSQFESEGVTSAQVVVSCAADVRYKGQASEIRIAVAGEQFDDGTVAALCEAFEQEHERLYGHRSDDENPVEVIALRLVGRAGGHDQEAGLQPARADGAGKVDRDAYFAGELLRVPVVDRDDLRGGGRAGPLLVDEYDSTIVVPPGVRAASDERGYLVMDIDDG